MSQLHSPAHALPSPHPAEAPPLALGPKLDFVFKKHKWLVAVGTVLGFITGFVLFLIFLKFDPQYTATAVFSVNPTINNPLNTKGTDTGSLSTDQVQDFINGQLVVVKSPNILQSALESDAFQHDYLHPDDPTRKSSWLTANLEDPLDSLSNALDVESIPHSDVFTLSMSWHDPVETARLINAVVDTYTQYLTNQEQTALSDQQKAVSDAQTGLQDDVDRLSNELEIYRASHDVPSLIEQRTALGSTLSELNTMLIQQQSYAASSKAQYQTIKQQVQDNTLQLSPAMQQEVEDDSNLRSLELDQEDLNQQIAVSIQTLGVDHPSTLALQIREATLQKQIDDLRNKLTVQARLQMQQDAEDAMISAQAAADDTQHRRDDLQQRMSDLGGALDTYESMQADLQSKEQLLDQMKQEAMMLSFQNASDTTRVQLEAAAVPPTQLDFPRPAIFLTLGTVLGLLISAGLAYLVELTNTRVNTPRDVTSVMRLPLLGFIPDQADDPLLNGNPMHSVRTSPASMTAESFRQIRGRLAAAGGEKPIQTLLVASFSPGGGATTVASNLANSIALSELRVLLIDANMYRPALRGIYPNIPQVGLIDVLTGQTSLDAAIVQSQDIPTLFLMGAGARPKVPTELTEHRAFPDFIAQLRSRFDMIIFDGAPLTFVSDSINLASKVDGVATVLRAGTITRGTVVRIKDQLHQVHANFLGIILNVTQAFSAGYFRQNYRTFFEYAGSSTSLVAQKSLPKV
ncbi:MAG TPA: polysaccharide biosynthesis tyrosine autokinase [Phycisphaerae bacterium]|nr:polysaccharide biosynthesis tyrosine autokinase [Phycisphaerae bacterium]